MRMLLAVGITMMLAIAAQAQDCNCTGTELTADYTQDRVPDALKDAYSEIVLNRDTWQVEFYVKNVRKISNGHVLTGSADTRKTAVEAFAPLTAPFNQSDLWTNPTCNLSAIDTPVASQGINLTTHYDCTREYQIIFSLVDASKQNQHCELNLVDEEILVNCSITMTAVRAYDATESTAFLAVESRFTGAVVMPNELQYEVADIMYATLAKCSVLNGPIFAIDCRVPGLWTFGSTFSAVSNLPDFIDAASCVQSQTTSPAATFVRCGLNSVPVGVYTEVDANVSATIVTPPPQSQNVTGSLIFSLQYTLPRAASATASASLQNFIESIGMLNEKYYYAGADRATMYIQTFDTSRLGITQLEMFNANGQVYNLRGYPQFQLTETSNATHFIIEWRPSAIRQDSAFYRNGPHGVNVSFLFTAAPSRRQMVVSSANEGSVTVNGLRVEAVDARDGGLFGAPENNNNNNNGATAADAAATGASTVGIIAGVAAACVVAIVVIVAAIVAVNRRKVAESEPQAAVEEITEDTV